MDTLYVISKQTTSNGTATDIKAVSGKDFDEALLKAKIKAYRTMEAFMNEATMLEAHAEVSSLNHGVCYVVENWKKEVIVEEPTEEVAEEVTEA